MKVKNCRICKSPDLYRFLDLGEMPLANSFLKAEDLGKPEPSYPLDAVLCRNCGFVQIGHLVPPELMFKNYIYFSSTSDTIRKHFAEEAAEIRQEFCKEGSLVVEIGSNDGVLLKNLLGKGVRPYGVEPATNVAKVAREAGVETLNDFFSMETAKKIAAEKGKAAVIIANNVFGHVPDPHDLVGGIRELLEDTGVMLIEVPYLADFYKNLEFDTIYHEHLSYFSLKPMIHLFGLFGMVVFDVKKFPVHGGTIRIYIQKKGGPHQVETSAIGKFLELERGMGLYEPAAFDKFAARVKKLKVGLRALLTRLKSEGKLVAAYGAPAKGNTLLCYCQIGTDLVEYAVDKSPYKQGYYTPGMHIPVYGLQKMKERKPDYLLLLAWNFADEIMRQQADFAARGGKFIIPIPEPKII